MRSSSGRWSSSSSPSCPCWNMALFLGLGALGRGSGARNITRLLTARALAQLLNFVDGVGFSKIRTLFS
eukprot:8757390-Pyramimonas_sp.AAC.1